MALFGFWAFGNGFDQVTVRVLTELCTRGDQAVEVPDVACGFRCRAE